MRAAHGVLWRVGMWSLALRDVVESSMEPAAGRGVPGKRTLTAALMPGRALAIAAQGVAQASRGALPYGAEIGRSFGRFDVSDVPVAIGGEAATASAALGARAYANDGRIGFAAAPDLHTAAHEAAHVVQQRAGVQLKDGRGERGDRYEQHADRVADLVVRGASAESTLAEMAGPGGGGAVIQAKDDPFGLHLSGALQLEEDPAAAPEAAPTPTEVPADDDQAGWIAALQSAAAAGKAELDALIARASDAAAKFVPIAGEYVLEVLWPSSTGWRFTADAQIAAFIGLEWGLEVAGRALAEVTITRQGGEVTIEIAASLEGGLSGDAQFMIGGSVGGKAIVEASSVEIEVDVAAALWSAGVTTALAKGDIGGAISALRAATPTLWNDANVSWAAAAGAGLAAGGGVEVPGAAEAGVGGNLDATGGQVVEETDEQVTTELQFSLSAALSGSVEITAPARDALAKLYNLLHPASDEMNPDSPALRNGDVMPGTSDAGTSVGGEGSLTLGLRTVEPKDGSPPAYSIGLIAAGEVELAVLGQRVGGSCSIGVYYPVDEFAALVDDLAHDPGAIINKVAPIEYEGSMHLTIADITAMSLLPGFDVSSVPGLGDDADKATATLTLSANFDPSWVVTPPSHAPPSLVAVFAEAKALIEAGQVIEAARSVMNAISMLPGSAPEARVLWQLLDGELELEIAVSDEDHMGDAATPGMGDVPGAALQGGVATANVYQHTFGPDAEELSPAAVIGLVVRLMGGA